MDLRQISALIAVADHGSFSAAARALHTVQSNVSTHVARLEGELGATLIDRSSGILTAEGEAVAERGRRVQAELEALTSDLASMNDQISGLVRLGIIGTTARWLAPLLLDSLQKTHPKIDLVIVDASTASLLPRLERGELDFAVVNTPIDNPDISIEPLFDEDRVVIAPVDHPLAASEELTIAELGDHELLLAAPGTSFRMEVDADAELAGVTLRAKAEVDGLRLVASLAFTGFGAAILPASANPGWLDPGGKWKRIPVKGMTRRSVGIARRLRGLPSAPARAASDVLGTVVHEAGPAQPGIYPA